MKQFVSMLLLAVMSATTLSAVSKVSQGDAALSAAQDDGIIVFVYAADWDRYSKRRCSELMQDKTIAEAAGSAVYMAYPCYESPSDTQLKKLEELRGKLNIPRALSYPAMILLNDKGHHICTIQGRDLTASKDAHVAKLVAEKLKTYKKQAALVTQAMAASGVQQATLMGQACRIEGINYPDQALEIIKKADPKDESGYTEALTTNDYKQAGKVREMELDAGIAYVKSVMDDDKYTTKARQGAIAGLLALWRSKGDRSQIPLMNKFCDKSIALDRDYYHAKSANQIKKLWLKEFTIESGWFATMLPVDMTPVSATGKVPITSAGTYTITMSYTGGKDGLTIKRITLYDGDSKLAEDAHDGFAGHNPVNNIYTLKVPKAPKKPRLEFVFNQEANGRSSNGRIDIKKQ